MAHQPNYVLLAAYNQSGHDTTLWQDEFNDQIVDDWEDIEAQFQLSVKFPLLVNMLDDTFDIYEPVDLLSFAPISSLCEKNNPRNINYMPVVIFFVCLDLEPKP